MSSIEELRKIYKEHDEDNNGTLNYHEALEAVKALGPFAKNYDDFRSEFSKVAKNGGLTFDEFMTFWKYHHHQQEQ